MQGRGIVKLFHAGVSIVKLNAAALPISSTRKPAGRHPAETVN